ncbi:class B sortase [Ruminococcus sp. 5_1_39BFAA]|uniref:class B sortase n=1 Tax=Ruminococcus sp. 5_1_39BFAA TaxID=457412 RepID=UPI0035622FD0
MKYIKEIMILAICLMVLGFSASVLFGIWCMYQEGVSEYRGLQEFAEEESEADADDSGVVKKKTAVDFDSLKEINGDIVAWIKCKELGINYPVVQGTDNSYYLTHTFSGEEHISGCIFMDCVNKPDFTDDNTILYGHNMKDGSMFGSFSQFMEETATVFLYTPEGEFIYQIIDDQMVDVSEGKYFRTVYSTEDFASLSETIAAHTGNALVRGEHLLTLSTCNGNANRRHLILCKEVTETNEKQMEEGTAGEVIQIEAGQEETTATAQKGAAKETQEAETK